MPVKACPQGRNVGFEIFEKTPFGVSEFTQQVNYLRALQGELSRTINSLAAVQSSRIHLAIPARANFLGPEEKPSASVVVDLRPGYRLSPDQVQGIVNLVAGSVPKLSSDKVIVIDSSGRPLKEIVAAAATTEAEKLNVLKLKHEEEMQRRIETMLDPILGPGKVIVRANVQVNLQETLMTKEEFDPDNKVVRSQRQSSDDSGAKGGGAPAYKPTFRAATRPKPKPVPIRPKPTPTADPNEAANRRPTKLAIRPAGSWSRAAIFKNFQSPSWSTANTKKTNTLPARLRRWTSSRAWSSAPSASIANAATRSKSPTCRLKCNPSSPLAPLGAPELKDMLMSPMGIGIGVGALLLIGGVLFFIMRGKKKPAAIEANDGAITGAQGSRADGGDRAGRGGGRGAEDRRVARPA